MVVVASTLLHPNLDLRSSKHELVTMLTCKAPEIEILGFRRHNLTLSRIFWIAAGAVPAGRGGEAAREDSASGEDCAG